MKWQWLIGLLLAGGCHKDTHRILLPTEKPPVPPGTVAVHGTNDPIVGRPLITGIVSFEWLSPITNAAGFYLVIDGHTNNITSWLTTNNWILATVTGIPALEPHTMSVAAYQPNGVVSEFSAPTQFIVPGYLLCQSLGNNRIGLSFNLFSNTTSTVQFRDLSGTNWAALTVVSNPTLPPGVASTSDMPLTNRLYRLRY